MIHPDPEAAILPGNLIYIDYVFVQIYMQNINIVLV